MNYFKEILRYAKPYKTSGILNITFNILFALFGALSFVSLIPMLDVLFDKTQAITEEPVWTGIQNGMDYLKGYLGYYVTTQTESKEQALIVVIALVLSLFFLKNLFGYLGMYFIAYLRNGVLKDIRDDLYAKIINLPISYFSEKRKGDVIAR
ncbi:antibiotic ABC transporter ATP-binding protein, partial [Pseudomonas fluorescens]